MSQVSRQPYRPLRIGGVRSLGGIIRATQLFAPEPDSVFPAWQGMQYMRDMFTGDAKLEPLDNSRYPDLHWTRLPDQLANAFSTPAPKAE